MHLSKCTQRPGNIFRLLKNTVLSLVVYCLLQSQNCEYKKKWKDDFLIRIIAIVAFYGSKNLFLPGPQKPVAKYRERVVLRIWTIPRHVWWQCFSITVPLELTWSVHESGPPIVVHPRDTWWISCRGPSLLFIVFNKLRKIVMVSLSLWPRAPWNFSHLINLNWPKFLALVETYPFQFYTPLNQKE